MFGLKTFLLLFTLFDHPVRAFNKYVTCDRTLTFSIRVGCWFVGTAVVLMEVNVARWVLLLMEFV